MRADKKSAFVMMPSGNHDEYKGRKKESDFIYDDIIRPSLIEALGENTSIIRETDNRKPGAITRDLIRNIAKADICIVDLTGLNPNVFLELGIRYALRRSITILLKQPEVELPFDITAYRCVEYSPEYFGPKKAREEIVETIDTALAHPSARSDSLVFNVLPDLRVEIPGVLDPQFEGGDAIMPWEMYWDQFDSVVNRLKDLVQDGSWVPQVVLGISNGGLIYADLLGRHVFLGIPILSLWADRINQDGIFFDHTVNKGVVASIKARGVSAESKVILLVDDIVASGTTLRQAIKYLEQELPEWKVYFLPLFSRNEKYLDLIRENIVWLAHPYFKDKLDDDEVRLIHKAEMAKLPYKKEIRST